MLSKYKKIYLFMWALIIFALAANVFIILFNPTSGLYGFLHWLPFWAVYSYLTGESSLGETEKRRFRRVVLSYIGFIMVILVLCLLNTWAEWIPIVFPYRITGILGLPILLFEMTYLIKAGRQKSS